MTGNTGAASDEFVEIVNAGTTAVAIGGWKIVYRSAAGTSDSTLATIADGTTLAPGAFYLAGGSAYSGTPVADSSFTIGMAGTGGGVGIKDGTGALIDSVGYGTATNAFVEGTVAAAPAAGESIGRSPDGHDTNANAADFSIDLDADAEGDERLARREGRRRGPPAPAERARSSTSRARASGSAWPLELGGDPRRQHLAELDAPLVERVDVPDRRPA